MATYTVLNEDPIIWQSSQIGVYPDEIGGSSRVGEFEPNMELSFNSDANDVSHTCTWLQSQPQNYYEYEFYRGNRKYELSNHLGKVLVVISDKRSSVCVSGVIDHYEADVLQVGDYYSGGMSMTGRTYQATSIEKYRFGMNTQEKDDEIFEGAYTAEFWEYDSRLVRRWNTDPIIKVWESPYACFYNNSIYFSDPLGLDPSEKRWWKNAINYTSNFLKGDSYKNKANKAARQLEKRGYENVDIDYGSENGREYAHIKGHKKTSESTLGNAGEITFTDKTFERETESWLQRNFPEGGLSGGGAGGESRPDFKKVGVPIMFGTATTLVSGGSALIVGVSIPTVTGMVLGINEMGTNPKGTIAQSLAKTKEQKRIIEKVEIALSVMCIADGAMNVRKLILNPRSMPFEDLKVELILNSTSSTIGLYDLIK